MRSVCVGLIVGVVSSLIAGLLLFKGDIKDLPLVALLSLPLQQWGWSLVILAVSGLGGLAYAYRLDLCLLVIDRSRNGWERVRERLAQKGSHSDTANQILQVEITSSLIEWEKEGDWTADTSHAPPDLWVTNSDKGGILRGTKSWADYEFEFETRIDREFSSWIIRADDLDNYVMLQCAPDKIMPVYRRGGLWWSEQQPVRLAAPLPRGWFKVSIRVEGHTVSAFRLEDDQRTVLFRSDLLGPRIVSLVACRAPTGDPTYVDGPVFMSYLRGGVGFRACGHESAYFRKITVRPIVEDAGSTFTA